MRRGKSEHLVDAGGLGVLLRGGRLRQHLLDLRGGGLRGGGLVVGLVDLGVGHEELRAVEHVGGVQLGRHLRERMRRRKSGAPG